MWAAGSRSDGGGCAGGSGRCGSGGGAPAARWRRQRLAGKTQNRVPGLGFECGLDREVEGDEGNRSRGFRGGKICRSVRATASGGSGTPARLCRHGNAGGRERWSGSILTTTRCSSGGRATAGGSGTAARRRAEARATKAAVASA
jgi:hypothetical protein